MRTSQIARLRVLAFTVRSRKSVEITISFTVLALCLLGAKPTSAQVKPTATTTLAVSSNTVGVREPVTLTATVVSNRGPVNPGLVTFCDATAAFCEDTAILGTAQLDTNGTAQINLLLGPGQHKIFAEFNGTTKYLISGPSLSNVQTVEAIGRLVSSADLSVLGIPGSYTLTSKVSGFGAAPPTGSIGFIAGANGLAFATVPLDTTTVDYGLGAPQEYGTAASSFVAKGDLNGDGVLDLVTVNGSSSPGAGSISVLLGDPAHPGQFLPQQDYATDGDVFSVVIADFNGDGIPDIAINNVTFNTVDVYLGDPSHPGSFLSPTSFPLVNVLTNYPVGLVTGDFNGDGLPDLAVANFNIVSPVNGSVSVLLNDPGNPGVFLPQVAYPLPPSPYPGFVVADFNNDGFPDLAVSDYTGNSVDVSLNDPSHPGQLLPPVSYPTNGTNHTLAVGDFNADGIPDIAAAVPDGLEIFIGDPANPGEFLAPVTYPLGEATTAVTRATAVADFNRDGALDVAFANRDGRVGLVYGDPAHPGTFLPAVKYYAAPFRNALSMVVGDFSGDGVTDVVLPGGDRARAGAVTLLPWAVTETATATGVDFLGTYIFVSYPGDANYYDNKSCQINPAVQSPVAPVISGVTVSNVTATSATISWTTDVWDYGGVNYGTTMALGSTTPRIGSIYQTHTFVLTDLTPATTYDYQVWSSSFFSGCASQTTTAAIASFVTPAQ